MCAQVNSRIVNAKTKNLPSWATYDGNRLIKKSGVNIKYDEEHIEELIRCEEDLEYFVSKYVYVVNPDTGKGIIKLREYQERLLTHLEDNRFCIIMATRQCGKSMTVAIFLLHYMIFNSDKKMVILANKLKVAKDIFHKIRVAYEMLPLWLQVGVVEWAKTSCVLENGSSCSAEATTIDGMRGITANIVVLDEFAHLHRNIATEFFTSMYPTISASVNSKLIIISTPNGMNHFHVIWKKAKAGKNEFKHFEVSWNEVPGRDIVWKEQTLKNIGETKFKQEYENAFIGSTNTLISSQTLESFDSGDVIDVLKDWKLKIYERYQKGHTYVIGVDCAKGTGYDYSVCQVLDITDSDNIVQVATYANNSLDTHAFGEVCIEISEMYDNAYLAVENNAEGAGVINTIWFEKEYEYMVDYDTKKQDVGIRATTKTKSLALDCLKRIAETTNLKLNDIDTIYELSKFSELRPGIFGADDGEHDDRVTALYWALFYLKLESYYDAEEIKKNLEEKKNETEDRVLAEEEPLLPMSNMEDDEVLLARELLS